MHDAIDKKPEANLESVSKDCIACRTCQEICQAHIEHTNKIVEIEMHRKREFIGGEFPSEEIMAAVAQYEVYSNSLGLGYRSRGDWAEELPVVEVGGEDTEDFLDLTSLRFTKEPREPDILYFVGCYASFDKRNIAVAKSFVQMCDAAGIKVGILGKKEKCCGEPVRKLGNESLYQSLATKNIELIKGYGVKKVVTTCLGCFNTLTKAYCDLGFDLEVEYYTVFLESLVKEGKLRLKNETSSCT